ncbi:MAG: BON domain-containing protein, partial [Vicinamibacterales bacterium]
RRSGWHARCFQSAMGASMIRGLLRLALIVVIIAVAAAFFLGYRLGDNGVQAPISTHAAVPDVDTSKARATGAAIGERIATGAAQAEQALAEGSLTAKIKAKMALDETVKALTIDIDTEGSVVTLSGSVNSEIEHKKAVQLARDTAGVASVVDRLVVR